MASPEQIAQFEKLGVRNVRGLIGEWSGTLKYDAMMWLAQKDEEERLRNEASLSSQMRTALSAKTAAWIAAIAATIAAIAAIATMWVELLRN